MATDRQRRGANSSAIDAAVVEAVAADRDVPLSGLSSALVVLDCDGKDAHIQFEREYPYHTVDGRRVYDVTDADWADAIDRNDLHDVAEAVREAHRRQADDLVDSPVETPIVIGVDTAEQMV